MPAIQQWSLQRPDRRGVSSVEAIVAFSIISSVLALSTPLIVAHGRLLKAQRNYRLAMDELVNQFERSSALPEEELPMAIEELAPSPLTAQRLPGAMLHGELHDSPFGKRLTLEIWWDEPNRQAAPLRMTAWIVSSASPENHTED